MNRNQNRAGWESRRGCSLGALLALAWLFEIFGTLGLAAAPKNPVSLKDYVRSVELSYRRVRTLRANFVQTYTSGGAERRESGVLDLASGGRMRWHYLEPEEKIFVANGKKLLLYIPAEKQLTSTPERSSEDFRAPLVLLLSRVNLRKVFAKIEFADDAIDHAADDLVLRAFPKGGKRTGYRQVLIELDPQLNIRRLVITYQDQSIMDFRFDRIERNPYLPAEIFVFTPPAGTEIIDER